MFLQKFVIDRRSAYKIIDRLSDKLEVSRRLVKVSWATGEGLKDDSKLLDFWDKQRGFHEIPWKSLPSQIDKLFEGGWADVETLPPKFKGIEVVINYVSMIVSFRHV